MQQQPTHCQAARHKGGIRRERKRAGGGPVAVCNVGAPTVLLDSHSRVGCVGQALNPPPARMQLAAILRLK